MEHLIFHSEFAISYLGIELKGTMKIQTPLQRIMQENMHKFGRPQTPNKKGVQTKGECVLTAKQRGKNLRVSSLFPIYLTPEQQTCNNSQSSKQREKTSNAQVHHPKKFNKMNDHLIIKTKSIKFASYLSHSWRNAFDK